MRESADDDSPGDRDEKETKKMANDKPTLTRRRVLGGMATIGVAGALGAGSWAAFSDEESATDNFVGAGTLDLTVNGGDIPGGAHFTASEVAPGYSQSQTLTLKNEGSIAGVLSVDFNNLSEDGGDNPEPEQEAEGGPGNSADLADNLTLTISGDYGTVGPFTLRDAVNNTPYTLDSNMTGPESGTETVTVEVPSNVGNEIQGDEVTFDVVFTLEQA
ncbi:MAG TPA: TasA family protein [Halococcus sp.]|nr:TasA family protein [Halococcus sp.]